MTDRTTHRGFAIASVIAAMFMIAIEATIVSTAMPGIVGQLGGLNLYSWVFSAFLLTQTATTVLFGRLADTIGRKRTMFWGIALFMVGSLLCGFAWSMPSMIAFRLIQGVGAGAIQPVGITIVGDLYPANERGRIQGWLASIWAISAVLGPLAGGLIVQHVSWAWVFWMNLPVGVLAATGFWFFLHERVARGKSRINHLGAAAFTLAIAAVMADLTAVSSGNTGEIAALTALTVAALLAFVVIERRSPEPMISLKLWGRRPIAACNAASLLAGMAMIGLTTFLPVYVQGVMGQTALIGGFALSAMVLGWPVASTLGARLLNRVGVRPILFAGGMIVPLGALVFALMGRDTPPYVAGIGSLVVGFGMGFLNVASLALIQDIVDWRERGSVTASFIFARNLGSTFGATAFGAVLNAGLARSGLGAVSSDELRRLLDSASGAPTALASLRDALEGSLHVTFLSLFVVAALTAAATFLVPRVTLGLRRAPAE